MPADYEASRQRDARFARRFLFTLLAVYALLHVLAGLAVLDGLHTLAYLLISIDSVAVFIAGAYWLSGKIFR